MGKFTGNDVITRKDLLWMLLIQLSLPTNLAQCSCRFLASIALNLCSIL